MQGRGKETNPPKGRPPGDPPPPDASSAKTGEDGMKPVREITTASRISGKYFLFIQINCKPPRINKQLAHSAKTDEASGIMAAMSRIRLIVTLAISIALIGGATWLRLARTTPSSSSHIISVENIGQLSAEGPALEDFLGTATSTPVVSATPPSKTETVSRQLFSDYISHTSKGQTTPDDLNQLAVKYADIIAKFETKSIDNSEITSVEDTPANFQTYADKIMTIRYKYKSSAEDRVRSLSTPGTTEKDFRVFAKEMGILYPKTITELEAIPTPVSLVPMHTQFINTYIGAAAAFEAAADDKRDPIEIYAAFSAITKNSEKENEIFLALLDTLLAEGISFAQES